MADTLKISAPMKYTAPVGSIGQYSRMRGVVDFTKAEQFNLYEKGYQQLYVLDSPIYIKTLCDQGDGVGDAVKKLLDAFVFIIENEFKGASGFDDITVDPIEVTDNISTLNTIGKVNKQSNAEITTTYTERTSAVITNFIKYYLEGIRDPRTQAKTYHGLIKKGLLSPGFENEIFTLLYIVTDNTMLRLNKSYLMCNAWPNSAKLSIYEGEKGSIEKVDVDVVWQCFLIDGDEVDARAIKILSKYNEDGSVANAYLPTAAGATQNTVAGALAKDGGIAHATTMDDGLITLDHNQVDYHVLAGVDRTIGEETSSS